MVERVNQPEREEAILALWERERVFARTLEREAPRGDFVFYEGPPTANAPPGLHHVIGRTFKDVLPRYKTMRGYRVQRKAGWDTHGLPVELQIEKRLGLKTKRDVEGYGIAAFNAQCRDSVWAFKAEWEALTRRIGFWLNMEDPYITYEMPYIESVWWFLKQVHERGLLTRAYKSTWYCPRCETPLSSHEVALGYDDVDDPSIIVKFRLRDRGTPTSTQGHPEESATRDPLQSLRSVPTSFLAWTTTPWTLPGNAALAVHPNVFYAVVDAGAEQLVIAEALVSQVFGEGARIMATVRGDALVGASYEPLYPAASAPARSAKQYTILPAAFVTLNEGTGIVHIAPAYGADDFDLGKTHGVVPIITVNPSGVMCEGFPGAGKFFKDADADVRADLRERGLLFRDERITHSYPFCWRCTTPLLTYARESWYIEMSRMRAEVQALNAAVDWHPSHIKDGRMGEWLRELKDWAITRERSWGAPLPIWQCMGNGSPLASEQGEVEGVGCGRIEILGSFAELSARAPKRNRFLFMHHGEAESNVQGVISARVETSDRYPLTSEGEARVRETAERLRNAGITKIVASPFLRMRQTAEIVGAAVGVTPEYADALREIDLPDFDGKPVAEHAAAFGSRIERFTRQIGENETWDALRVRLLTYLKTLDETHEGEMILVCTHGDGLWLIAWALSGFTRANVDLVPYPDFDAPHELPFIGALVSERGEFDVHRPAIDAITWPCAASGCRGTMERYPEVADVWLESGCMPFAQHHYPFEPIPEGLADADGSPKPAAYIAEAIDQTRGWFYTLLAVATVLERKQPPFEHCIVYSHILDTHGKKMSKSKGNIVEPNAMIAAYGADVVRWYMLTINQPWDPKAFDEQDLQRMARKPFGTLMNVLSFWELHGGGAQAAWVSDFSPSVRGGGDQEGVGSGPLLDSWLRARFVSLHHDVTEHLDAYRITEAARAIEDAVDDLSTWWLRRSRERLKAGDVSAQQTFTAALETLAVLLAPFAPFTAEHVWQVVRSSPSPRPRGEGEQEGERWSDSVHLASWDTYTPPSVDDDMRLLADMAAVRRVVSLGLEARDAEKIPVRQPLAKLSVGFPTSRGEGGRVAVGQAFLALIAEEVNVKTVIVDAALTDAVCLDTAMTPELQREGMVRELIRKVNGLRKDMGLQPSDRIAVTYHTDDADLASTIKDHRPAIERGTMASFSPSVSEGEREGVGSVAQHTMVISGAQLTLDIVHDVWS